MTKQLYDNTERTAALEKLREWLPVGKTVYCLLRGVVRADGGSRRISTFAVVDGRLQQLDYWVLRVLNERSQRTGGVRVQGGGMDMGGWLVYVLGQTLYPDGYGLEALDATHAGRRAVSPEVAAAMVARGALFAGRNGGTSGWEPDGGFALHYHWL